MIKLIEEWERLARRYHRLGVDADHNPIRQEGLLCRAEVYDFCASKLRDASRLSNVAGVLNLDANREMIGDDADFNLGDIGNK